MSENWEVASFWVKLWALVWLLLAQFIAMMISRFFGLFRNAPPSTGQ